MLLVSWSRSSSEKPQDSLATLPLQNILNIPKPGLIYNDYLGVYFCYIHTTIISSDYYFRADKKDRSEDIFEVSIGQVFIKKVNLTCTTPSIKLS